MLQKILPLVRKLRTGGVHERRHADRIELMSPLIAAVAFDDMRKHVCVVRNVGPGGALLEFQTESELSGLGNGMRCAITDMMPEAYSTICNVNCLVEWMYHKFVGVAFAAPFFENHDAIIAWLKRIKMSYRFVEDDQ